MNQIEKLLIEIYNGFREIGLEQKKLSKRRKELSKKLINLNKDLLSTKKEGSFKIRLPLECDGFFRIIKSVDRKLDSERIIEDFIKLPKPFRMALKPVYVLDLEEYRKAIRLGLNFNKLDYIKETERDPRVDAIGFYKWVPDDLR